MMERRRRRGDRRFAEECMPGDVVQFIDGPPQAQRGRERFTAPADTGEVRFVIWGGAVVRFGEADLVVDPGQRVRVLQTLNP